MITVKHLDHISMAAPSWRKQSELLHRLLGFKFLHGFGEASTTGFGGCVSQVPGTDIEFEIMDPVGENSFIQKFLDEQGPGLHHITIEVSDINETIAELQRLGIKPFGGLQDDGMWRLTYIHPKDSGGILWQLFTPHKFPPEVDRATTGGALGVRRVDHVSMAVPDLEKQIAWQERVFGMVPGDRWRDENLGYDGCVLTIPNSQLEFEIIAPSRPDGFVQKFIDTRRPGMHHICCEVESVEACAAALKQEGIEPFGGILGGDGNWHKHTFIHPRDSGGVLFQLFEE